MRRALSLSFSERDEQSESTSSMKMMLGLCARANSKRFFTNFSDSPSHFDTRSELFTEKKVELLASVATALARYDLPVPGGYNMELNEKKLQLQLDCQLTPNSKMPFHATRLPVNKCGNLIGRMTASFSASLAPSRPATSDHLTFGFSRIIAPSSCPCNFFFSGSSPSESLSLSFFLPPLQKVEFEWWVILKFHINSLWRSLAILHWLFRLLLQISFELFGSVEVL